MAEQQRPTWGMESCCDGDRGEVTQVDIHGDGMTIGIVGLRQLFEQLYAEGLRPEDLSGERILATVKSRNYVPRPAEEAYNAALLREYAAFWAQRQREHR